MPLNLRASDRIQDFNLAVSYNIYDRTKKFLDARNVFSTQNRLETRFGYSRYNNVALPGEIISGSFFSKSDGTSYCLAKVGTSLYSVPTTGSPTVIKSGLSASAKHRGITDNDRHIISIESDGLFSWDGTTFSQLGQAAPTTLTAVAASGGSLTSGSSYQAAITFYSTSLGFETNYLTSSIIGVSGGNLRLALSDIPATAANTFIDKVRIYLKDVTANGAFLFISEETLGTTSKNIDSESTSTQEPPINNGAPLAGGGKYLVPFNSKVVYSGNASFPNEVYFSEEDLPDAFNPNDDQLTLVIKGQGGVTGLGVGLVGQDVHDPFLCIFKRKSTHIYTEINGEPRLVTLSFQIGCVSHDTIQVKNGVVYFLSEEGWRAIANGRLITNREGEAITLGNGAIDDIFKSTGYVYEVNRTALSGAFSVYYPTLDQYMTWVSEGTNNAFTKTYVYEFGLSGFKPWEFSIAATCAFLGENASGRDMVLFGTSSGYIMKHSIMESRNDVDINNSSVAISAFAVLPWLPMDSDFDATYNFRELILRAISSSDTLSVRTFLNFNLSNTSNLEFTFSDPNSGFILDMSLLDEGVFGDERSIVPSRGDINRVGESIAIGFYQTELDANIGLVSMQIDQSKNGNRNL
jgi:hypothetical protein